MIILPFYETKPCIIEAIQFTGDNYDEIFSFTENKAFKKIMNSVPCLAIETLEGTMIAKEGSYIIRGTQGEYYSCVPEVFIKKYKLAEGEINYREA